MAAVIDPERFRSRAASSLTTGGEGGGTMDDVLKRLGVLETSMSEVRADVRAIKVTLPHLATKADLEAVRSELKEAVGTLRAELKEVAGTSRSELNEAVGVLRSEIKEAFGMLRAEIKETAGALRSELKEAVGTLRSEIKEVAGTSRSELNAAVGSLRSELHAMETRLIKWIIGTGIALWASAFGIARYFG